GRHIFVYGQPGVGKTAACKHLLRELQEETDEIAPLYINCWKNNSTHRAVLNICEQLGYKWVQNRRTEELMKEIAGILNKKGAVIVLDEIDKLECPEILYPLLEDIYKRTIILITNDKGWLAGLDERIRSRLLAEMLEFQAYNLEETRGILNQRIEYAFVKGCWEKEALLFAAEKTFEMKDIRIGLFLLKEAGNEAEGRNADRITLQEAETAFSRIASTPLKKEVDNETQTVLELLKEAGSKQEAYEKYKEQYKKSYRTFQRKMKEVKDTKVVDA
ncbi:AAA family ATPase, partial [archaeon]|nr:AAA family ATPase [archaeon]